MNVDKLFKIPSSSIPSGKNKRKLSANPNIEVLKAPEALDSTSVRKMILKFEKAITKNQELRVKYSDDPSKFMESEADLDEEIKHLLTLTEVPDLYPLVVQLGAVTHLVSLLSHENTDISIDVVEVLNELTDEDVVAEHEEDAMKIFIDALLENQLLELLVQNLHRLDEEEQTDKQGIFNTLEKIISDTKLLEWILARIKVKGFDSNKQYCSELLAILLQNSRANRLKLGELNGIDALLQVLNAYKRKDPKEVDEIEMMENFFDALCSGLNEPEIKRRFLEGEGVELMLIMMKEKMMSRMRAIKVLDYALSTPEGTSNCERFVDIFGLKTLFSTFMRKGLKKLKKTYKAFSETEEEEHIIGIIVSLLKNLSPGSDHRSRLINKFTESEFEKVDRLLEMRENYEHKVEIIDKEIEEEKKAFEEDEDYEINDETLDEFYLRRLNSGLFTLQLVDLTISWICYEEPQIKEHVTLLLNRRGRSLNNVKNTLEGNLK
ncbi:11599_t:CDS:10 [Diversispora eburnea]|uniref:11599_t:CDS:1 n=1 Tax=Diversispora eburnea TaxID=1213867 RepID=A0A9N9A5W6_9GLOM|nr:11599_t:CDS:10 [Diversispora eburnea]